MPSTLAPGDRSIPGADPGKLSLAALANGNFGTGPITPFQWDLPWLVIVNADSIAHTVTCVTRAGNNSVPFNVGSGQVINIPTSSFTGGALDGAGTAGSVYWFYSDVGAGTTPPSGAGSTGLAATYNPQNLSAAATLAGSFVMAGFGILYTPLKTGIIAVFIGGGAESTVAASSGMIQFAWGLQSGGVPTNGAAPTGTVFNTPESIRGLALSPPTQWDKFGLVTGAVAGVPIWIDVQYKSTNTTDGFALEGVDALVFELGQ
jgi:hypothetical protein